MRDKQKEGLRYTIKKKEGLRYMIKNKDVWNIRWIWIDTYYKNLGTCRSMYIDCISGMIVQITLWSILQVLWRLVIPFGNARPKYLSILCKSVDFWR
jgi:hypothetical protein